MADGLAVARGVNFHFFFGPDKIAVEVRATGEAVSDLGVPFHGIISRGVMQRAGNRECSTAWLAHAHRIHDGTRAEDAELVALRDNARECAMLSFGQSATAVQRYVQGYCDVIGTSGEASCDLWNVKEGHTSSVWRAALTSETTVEEPVFAVNVARDREAGLELAATAETMKEIAARCADINMAKVLDLASVAIDMDGESIEVPVTRNEWIHDAYELGCLATNGDDAENTRYVAIDRFLTVPERPSHICSVRGRLLAANECRVVAHDISTFLSAARSACVDRAVDIDINDGDVVWNGRRAIVVAIR